MTELIRVCLLKSLHSFGFSSKVNALITGCVSVESVDLLINGSIISKIDMQRGIRQGNPLSPFLFIMYAKLLSRMLLKFEQEGKLHGIKIGKTSPAISYILFADDILLFYRANLDDVKGILECLDKFCRWTGQKINFAKSGCFFLKNTPRKVKSEIKKLCGLKEISKEAKYLGNSLFHGRQHSKDYEDLKNKVESKLQGWKAKLLSQAGKFTLVKSVISTIHIYAMSAVKIPKTWCNSIKATTNIFL